MPKTRSSGNTIASRGNGGGRVGGSGVGGAGGGIGGGTGGVGFEGNEEMSDRIDERLQEARSVDVEVESRSRNGMERVRVDFDPATPGVYQVHSASGNAYTVNEEEQSCTCNDHVHRQRRCRHIEAVAIAQEEMPRGFAGGSMADRDINANEVSREHINNERALEDRNAERSFSDDEHFYSDNPAEFEQDMARLRTAPIPYEYHNVLNGSDLTFGIELEFVNGDSNAIARELYNLGICQSPRMLGYHSPSEPGKWKLERDGSVTSGNFGGELVSPILRDTPETWQQIEKICEVARRHGAEVNYQTGGHVHVSVEPLDGKRQRWRRLFKAFSGTEEAVFRLSGGEMGQIRSGHRTYATSTGAELRSAMRTQLPEEGSLNDFRARLADRAIGWTKYRSFNLVPFTTGTRPTLEIRAFNGSLTPGVIQANIKTSVGLIHAAERARIQGGAEGLTTPSFRKRGRMINDFSDNRQDNSTMIRMLDTFFTRKSDKEHILSVMAKNNWR
jgi:hypothetical protein